MDTTEGFSLDRVQRKQRGSQTILGVLVGISAGIAMLLGYIVWAGYHEAVEQARIKTHDYALTLASRLEVKLSYINAGLAALAIESGEHQEAGLVAKLEAFKSGFSGIQSVALIDAMGNVRLRSGGLGEASLVQRRWFRQLKDSAATTLYGEAEQSPATGSPNFAVVHALRDARGALQGALIATIDLSEFQRMVGALNLGPNGRAGIFRSDTWERVLRWPEVGHASLNVVLPADYPVRQSIERGETSGNTSGQSPTDRRVGIGGFHTIKDSPFGVAVAVLHEDVLADWRQRALLIGLVALATLGLMGVLLFRLRRAAASQHEAAALLEQSEQRSRLLVEWTPQPSCVHRDGHFLYVNPAFVSMMGAKSEQELLGQSLLALVHPDDQPAARERIAVVAASDNPGPAKPMRVIRLDGTVITTDGRSRRIVYEGRPAIYSVVSDVSDRLRREQLDARYARQLKEKEAFTTSILNSLSEQIAVLDQQGVIVAVNRAWGRFAEENGGASPAFDPIGTNYLDVCEQGLGQPGVQEAQQALAGLRSVLSGAADSFTLRYPCNTPGQDRWFLMHAYPMMHARAGVVVIHEDITTLMSAQNVLRDADIILNATDDAIVSKALDGTIRSWNPGAQRMFGYSAEEAIGQPLPFAIPPELVQEQQDLLARVVAGERIKHFETVRLHKNGTRIHISVSISPLHGHAGRVIGFSMIGRDVTERKLAETALRVNEQRLQQLVRAASLGLWEWNLEDGSVYLSAEWKRQIGYEDHEVPNVAGAWTAYLQVDDAERVRQELDRFVHRETDLYHTEFRMRHRDGSWRWIESRAEMMIDASGRPVLVTGSHLDITERKNIELRLLRSEVLKSKAESLALTGSWDWDLKGGQSIWSDQLFRIYGRDPAAGIPGFYAWEETVHPDDREALRKCHQAVLAKGGSYEMEFRIHTHDYGTLRHLQSRGEVVLDPDGSPRRFWGVDQDITDRKLKEAARLDAERRFQGIVSSAMDGIITIDKEHRIVVFNEAAAAMFRCRPEDAMGQTLDRFVPERLRERHRAHIEGFARDGGAGRPMGARFPVAGLRSDGSEFPMEASISGARMGREMQLTVILRDISLRTGLEAQLRESQKMEAIGTLAGGIAHDFNNIVAAILGNALLAEEKADASDRADLQASLSEIHRAALRAKSLVNQILSFSRRQSTDPRAMELQVAIREAIALLRATIPAGVGLTSSLSEQAVIVRADATQVEQVLVNLCTNAWHAGARAISIGLVSGPRPPWHPVGQSGDDGTRAFAILSVQDNGAGIEEANLHRIFEPFFTTKAVGEGTGLGLAVVHGIIKQHGGSITVESTVGLGSTFKVCLPMLTDVALAGEPLAAAPPSAIKPVGLRVLYVDDDDAMTLLFERLMTRRGFHVTTCSDATTALSKVIAEPDGFDILVSDYNMPGASGTELAQAVLHIRPNLPVLLTSGNVTDSLLAQARAIGVRSVVSKPDGVETMAQLILATLAKPAD